MKNWHVVVIVIGFAVAVSGVLWLGLWLDARRLMEPHCVCSQQTCFPAPDGGWRK